MPSKTRSFQPTDPLDADQAVAVLLCCRPNREISPAGKDLTGVVAAANRPFDGAAATRAAFFRDGSLVAAAPALPSGLPAAAAGRDGECSARAVGVGTAASVTPATDADRKSVV